MDKRKFNISQKAYNPEQWTEKIQEYLEYMESQTWIKYEAVKSGDMAGELIAIPTKTPLTRKNLCIFAGISEETLRNYASNKEGYENHFEVTNQILMIIDNNQIEGALVGTYNTNLVARIQGLTEKVDNTTNGKDINNSQPIIVNVNSNYDKFASSEDEITD